MDDARDLQAGSSADDRNGYKTAFAEYNIRLDLF